MKKLNLFLTLLALATSVQAASFDDLVDKELGVTKNSESVLGSSTTLVRLQFEGSTPTVVATHLNQILTFQQTSVNDVSIGNNGIFTLTNSTMNTLGELCDAVNAAGVANAVRGNPTYSCTLLAGKRDDLTLLLPDFSSIDITGAGADVGMSTYAFQGIGITPAKGKFVRLKKCNWLSNGTTWMQVTGKLARVKREGRRDDSTLAWSAPNFANIPMSTNFAEVSTNTSSSSSLQEGALDFAVDEHVVVRNSTMAATPLVQILTPALAGTVGRLSCSWEER